MGSCSRRHSSPLMARSVTRIRSRRVLRLRRKWPPRETPQIWVSPRTLNVSGLPRPRRARRSAAKRPNSIRRVLSGCSANANFSNRSRRSARKRLASLSYVSQQSAGSVSLRALTTISPICPIIESLLHSKPGAVEPVVKLADGNITCMIFTGSASYPSTRQRPTSIGH
jgi:hypothetical protein